MMRVEASVSEVLSEEAKRASVADNVVARLLGERPQPNRRATPTWPAMATSAVVLLAVTMLAVPVLQRDPPTGLSSGRESLTSSPTGARQSIPPGYVDLHVKGVHVALDGRGAAGRDPWRSWQLPCEGSLLAPARSQLSQQAACAGRRGNYPRWEVLVAPASSHVTLQPRHFMWLTPVSRSVASIGLPLTDVAIGERAAILTTVKGMAHYPCASDDGGHRSRVGGITRIPCPRGGWVHRTWTTIYFPDHRIQVSLLAPNPAAIAWLTSTIYVA
ncbi:MAG: hypothetical protein WAK18_12975 [Nocardioidaceae bacterium]